MKFKASNIFDLLEGEGVDLKLIQEEVVAEAKWGVRVQCIFSYKEKYYSLSYDMNSQAGWDSLEEYAEDNEIECPEVFPVEVTKTEYLTKEQIEQHETH